MAKKNSNEAASAAFKPTETTIINDDVIVAYNNPTGVIFSLPNHRSVTIQGNAVSLRGKEKGQIPFGAFGFSRVAKEDWEHIKAKYGKMAIFKNGLIFASDRKDKAIDAAEERNELRHGFEPIDPDKQKTSPEKVV
jgi:hypothetical protein